MRQEYRREHTEIIRCTQERISYELDGWLSSNLQNLTEVRVQAEKSSLSEDWESQMLCFRYVLEVFTELVQLETPGSEGKCVSRAHLPDPCAHGANVRRENTEQNGSRMGGSFL